MAYWDSLDALVSRKMAFTYSSGSKSSEMERRENSH